MWLSNDYSSDIFNHSIMIQADYGKVCYPPSTHLKNITWEQMGKFRTLMAGFFFFFVHLWLGWYQHKEKTQEGETLYRLWFVLDSNGSFYSVFCNCKCGADQECRHLGAVFDGFFFFKSKKVCPLYACILEPQTNSYTQTSA